MDKEKYFAYLEQKGHAPQNVIEARNAYEKALEDYIEAVQEWEFSCTVEFVNNRGNISE